MGELFLYSVRLDAEGGEIGRDYAGRTSKVWVIEEWTLQQEKLVFKLRSGARDQEVMGMHGEVKGGA